MIELPWPSHTLNPNNTSHWRVKAKVKQAQKDIAYAAAKAVPPPKVTPVHLKFIFYPPDKRKRDLDNLLASMKAACDGISYAWEINDSQFRPITIDMGTVIKKGKVVICVIT